MFFNKKRCMIGFVRVTDLYKNTNVFYGRNVKQISYNSLEYLVFSINYFIIDRY